VYLNENIIIKKFNFCAFVNDKKYKNKKSRAGKLNKKYQILIKITARKIK